MEIELKEGVVDFGMRMPWQKKLDRVRYKDVKPCDLTALAQSLWDERDWRDEISVNGGLLTQRGFRNRPEFQAFAAGIYLSGLIAERKILTYTGDAPMAEDR